MILEAQRLLETMGAAPTMHDPVAAVLREPVVALLVLGEVAIQVAFCPPPLVYVCLSLACMHASVGVCVCVCVRVHTHARVHARTCMPARVCVCVCVCVCV